MSNIGLARRLITAWANRDSDTVASLIAPDAIYLESNAAAVEAPMSLAERFAQSVFQNQLPWKLCKIDDAKDGNVSFTRQFAIAAGISLEYRVTSEIRIRDGQVISWKEVPDNESRKELRRALSSTVESESTCA